MSSFTDELIASELKHSFKKNKCSSDLNTCISITENKILYTDIELVELEDFKLNILDSLKSNYVVLGSNCEKLCSKCQNKSLKMRPLPEVTDTDNSNPRLPLPETVLFPPEDIILGWQGTVPIGSGFINNGTTCYINSTLQALFHIPSFVNWLIRDKKHVAACEQKNGTFHYECMVCALSKTLQMSHKTSGASIRPRLIVEKIKLICKHLSACRQEDAHEFLRYLIEALDRSYLMILGLHLKKLDNYSKETTPLSQIFGGYMRTEVTCLECSHMSTTFQHFQDVILDIRQCDSVMDALEHYFSEEQLDVDGAAYHCDKCKKKVRARKKYSIEKAPNVLCIQLKRFNAHSLGGKLSKPIGVDQFVDITQFRHRLTTDDTLLKYRMVSMIFHHGASINSGHYTALGMTSSGSYYYFNDEQVHSCTTNSYSTSSNAYIIFYELSKSSLMNKPHKKELLFNGNGLRNGYHNGTLQYQTNSTFPSRRTIPSILSSNNRPHCSVLPQKDVKTSANFLCGSTTTTVTNTVVGCTTTGVTCDTANNIDNNNAKNSNNNYNNITNNQSNSSFSSTVAVATRPLVASYCSDDDEDDDDDDDDENNNKNNNNNCHDADDKRTTKVEKNSGSDDESDLMKSKENQSSRLGNCYYIIAALKSDPLNKHAKLKESDKLLLDSCLKSEPNDATINTINNNNNNNNNNSSNNNNNNNNNKMDDSRQQFLSKPANKINDNYKGEYVKNSTNDTEPSKHRPFHEHQYPYISQKSSIRNEDNSTKTKCSNDRIGFNGPNSHRRYNGLIIDDNDENTRVNTYSPNRSDEYSTSNQVKTTASTTERKTVFIKYNFHAKNSPTNNTNHIGYAKISNNDKQKNDDQKKNSFNENNKSHYNDVNFNHSSSSSNNDCDDTIKNKQVDNLDHDANKDVDENKSNNQFRIKNRNNDGHSANLDSSIVDIENNHVANSNNNNSNNNAIASNNDHGNNVADNNSVNRNRANNIIWWNNKNNVEKKDELFAEKSEKRPLEELLPRNSLLKRALTRDINTESNSNIVSTQNVIYGQNGYGVKVHTWNGDVSYISKEIEQEKSQFNNKSNCNYSYNNELDEGKVKKCKYSATSTVDRNESKNPCQTTNSIQEYHNSLNSNSNNNNNNNSNGVSNINANRYRNHWNNNNSYNRKFYYRNKYNKFNRKKYNNHPRQHHYFSNRWRH